MSLLICHTMSFKKSSLPLVIFGVVPVTIVAVGAGVALVVEMSKIRCQNIQIFHEHTCIFCTF